MVMELACKEEASQEHQDLEAVHIFWDLEDHYSLKQSNDAPVCVHRIRYIFFMMQYYYYYYYVLYQKLSIITPLLNYKQNYSDELKNYYNQYFSLHYCNSFGLQFLRQ